MPRLFILPLLLVGAFPVAGCNDGGKDVGVTIAADTPPPSAASIDKQIADIKANTHMPESAKQAAISQLETTKATNAARPK